MLEQMPERSASVHFKPRGSNHMGMRQYNERVVLQALRLHGAVAKADLARLTHLSTQTVSLIVDRLHQDELVLKQQAVRGKVGQPSIPITLNPEGAYSIGIKVGRRSADVLLLDFVGQVRQRAALSYDFPDPPALLSYLAEQSRAWCQGLGNNAQRIAGVGVAAPLSLGGWQSLLGVEPSRAQAWEDFDLNEELAQQLDVPVLSIKDTAAACVAELVAGHGRSVKSFLYIFLDTFVGGGLVLDSQWRSGLHGNAGAVGSMALAAPDEKGRTPAQALSIASLHQLEQRLIAHGLDGNACYSDAALEAACALHTQEWLVQASQALSLVVHNAACLLDLDAVIVDGNLGRGMLSCLIEGLRQQMGCYSWEGVHAPALMSGTVGADARAIGGGLLPLYSAFAPDPDVFLKLDR